MWNLIKNLQSGDIIKKIEGVRYPHGDQILISAGCDDPFSGPADINKMYKYSLTDNKIVNKSDSIPLNMNLKEVVITNEKDRFFAGSSKYFIEYDIASFKEVKVFYKPCSYILITYDNKYLITAHNTEISKWSLKSNSIGGARNALFDHLLQLES